jgi:hypothetical protein
MEDNTKVLVNAANEVYGLKQVRNMAENTHKHLSKLGIFRQKIA